MHFTMDRFYKLKKNAMKHLLGTITHVQTRANVAALSFDDGPDPKCTPAILETLEMHKARATFFMVGEAAQKHPEIVRKIAKAGHAIGNHSWDHRSFPLLSGLERRKQIRDCAKSTAPYGQRLFRPPYGDQSLASRLDAFRLGYKVVTWNLVAEDWHDNEVDSIVNHIVKRITPGSIILFHDALYKTSMEFCDNRDLTLHTVDMVLHRLSNRFRFITIPELLRHGPPMRRNWYQKPNLEFLNRLKLNVE